MIDGRKNWHIDNIGTHWILAYNKILVSSISLDKIMRMKQCSRSLYSSHAHLRSSDRLELTASSTFWKWHCYRHTYKEMEWVCWKSFFTCRNLEGIRKLLVFHYTVHAPLACAHPCSGYDKLNWNLRSKADVGKKNDWLFLCMCYIHISPQFSEVYKQSCVHRIPQWEKLIRQGPAKADTFHKNEENNILRQMGHYSFSRWLG